MASLASRSTGTHKFDGLLLLAAEICGIVRASYLSPSFPFFFCFELWQYLKRQLSKCNASCTVNHSHRPKTSSNAGYPSPLRLLRPVALAVTLMLPAEGWAQVQGASAAPLSPDAPVPQKGNASARQNGMPSANSPIFPRNGDEARCDSREYVEAGRAPAHFGSGAKFQHRRNPWCGGQSLAETEVAPGV
jgi:hypothetical protein